MKIKSFKKLTDEQIKKIENRIHVKLPEDYREFLKSTGGGVVEKDETNRIMLKTIGREIVLDVLYGDDENNESGNIMFWMKQFEGEMLENSIIIGDDLFQGFLVMVCDGVNKGIYYWDDSYNFQSSNDENNMYWIADSFEQLFKHLTE